MIIYRFRTLLEHERRGAKCEVEFPLFLVRDTYKQGMMANYPFSSTRTTVRERGENDDFGFPFPISCSKCFNTRNKSQIVVPYECTALERTSEVRK